MLLPLSSASSREPRAEENSSALVKVVRQITPHFPIRLMRQGVTRGEATIAVAIEPDGKLHDFLVSRYTHRDFADAALDAVKEWKFSLSQPVGVVMEVSFLYEITGVLAIERYGIDARSNEETSRTFYAYQPCAPKDLDHPPKVTRQVPPVYPEEFERQGLVGVVTIHFYIDEQGHARLPVPAAAENQVLGSLATAAVAQWQFEPPTRGGKPVLVRAAQRFAFVAKN